MKTTAVELRRIRLPLVSRFRASFGTQTERPVPVTANVARDVDPQQLGIG